MDNHSNLVKIYLFVRDAYEKKEKSYSKTIQCKINKGADRAYFQQTRRCIYEETRFQLLIRINNAIQRYTFVDETSGVYHSTYGNLGERQSVGSYIYGRWIPISLFNLTLNGGVSYMNYKANELGQKNDGVRGNVYSNAQVNLPKDFRINVYGGYYSPWIMLQGKGSSHYFTRINVNKDFLAPDESSQCLFICYNFSLNSFASSFRAFSAPINPT